MLARFPSLQKSFGKFLIFALVFTTLAPSLWLGKLPPAYASTITVSNLNDSGAGSLRAAIIAAEASPGEDLISFSVAGTITLASALPGISESVTLDATSVTQAGANIVVIGTGSGYILSYYGGSNYTIKGMGFRSSGTCIEVGSTGSVSYLTVGGTGSEDAVYVDGCSLSGVGMAAGASHMTVINTFAGTISPNRDGIAAFNGASDITIGGSSSNQGVVSVNNTNLGIRLDGISNATVTGSFIGVDSTGTIDQGNTTGGINVTTSSSNVTIGGTTSAERNIISGNTGFGVRVFSGTATIEGNYIGTDVNGSTAIPNDAGGVILRTSSNVVGGTIGGAQNVISGNGSFGIQLNSSGAAISGNIIKRNVIGLNAANTAALANSGPGITFTGSNGSTGTIIGAASQGNVISGNTSYGIYVAGTADTGTIIQGNTIGLDDDITNPFGNGASGIVTLANSTTIGGNNSGEKNYISANTGYGIDVQSSSNTIKGNVIGSNISQGTSSTLQNTDHGIQISSSAASNTIGGIISSGDSPNRIIPASGKYGVNIATGAGNYNLVRQNHFPSNGASSVAKTDPANESITTPTISSCIRINANTIRVGGITPASASMDYMIDGLFSSSNSADSGGNFTVDLTSTSGTVVHTLATNATSSTSNVSNTCTVVTDSIAPTAPDLSYNDEGTAGSTVTISGRNAEVGTTLYLGGASLGTTIGSDGTFSYAATIQEGTNTFSFTLVDGMSNVGTASVATIIGINGGGSGTSVSAGATGSGLGGGSSGSRTQTEDITEDIYPTNPIPDPEDLPSHSIEEETTTTTSTTTSSSSSTSTSTSTQTAFTEEEIHQAEQDFTQKIYDTVKTAIKPKPVPSKPKPSSPRDQLPEKPARAIIYHPYLLKSPTLSGTQIIELKLKDLKPKDDTDKDGLLNGEEVINGSDPLQPDTDHDGFTDFNEVEFKGTDPASWDTDNDLIGDAKDKEPLTPNDIRTTQTSQSAESTGSVDSDEDGLSDAVEVLINTNPNETDSDGDSLSDGDEITHFGTDPLNKDDQSRGTLHIVDKAEEESAAEGEQFLMGSTTQGAEVGVYEVSSAGALSLLGQSTSDEKGRFTLYTKPLTAGTHVLVVLQGTVENPQDVSRTYTLNVFDWVKRPEYVSLALKNGSTITDRRPIIDLAAADPYLIIVSWRSSVYSQVLIADSTNQVVYAQPPESLELGEHTVTWYAKEPDTGHKSNPTRVGFTVTNQAVVNGNTSTSPWLIALASLLILASLTAIGFYYGKRSPKTK